MGRPRKFKTPADLKAAWTAYTAECDSQAVLTHRFSANSSRFVSAKLHRAITYTIEGFCHYVGLSRSAFYETYCNDIDFSDTVTRAREACEVRARYLFELGVIPTRLAGLWMSNFGYSTKANTTMTGPVPSVASGESVNPLKGLTIDELRRLAALDGSEDQAAP